jgi:hypothetical protein
MAKTTYIYEEEEEDGFRSPQTVALSKGGVDELDDLMHFIGNCIRASGFTYVERIAWENEDGQVFWSY